MGPLLNERIFSIEGATFTGGEVIAAARQWGDWAKLEQAVREELACAEHADTVGDDVDDTALEAAASSFRYERDLVSGVEMEAWLGRWSLTVDDWMEYLRRSLLRERSAAGLRDIVATYPVDPADVDQMLHANAVCSGFFVRMVRKLANHAGAAARARREGWLGDEAPDGDARGWLERIDTGFRLFCAHVVTFQRLEAEVAAHRLDWIHTNGRRLWLPTLDAAKEAAVSLREDGITIEEVARNAGVVVEVVDEFLEDCDVALRDPLRASRRGEVVGPIALAERFAIVLVQDKVLPSLDDPAVRRRAEERLIESALAREVQEHVEWHQADFDHSP